MKRIMALRSVTVSMMMLVFIPNAHISMAQEIEQAAIAIKNTTTIDAVGNAHVDLTLKFDLARNYDSAKRKYPDLYMLFRDTANDRSVGEIDRSRPKSFVITSDDAEHSIHFEAEVLGLAVNKKTGWQIPLDIGEEMVFQEGMHVVTSEVSSQQSGLMTAMSTYVLPRGAHDVQFDKAHHQIKYLLSAPTQPGHPDTELTLHYKSHVMSSLYKLYASSTAGEGQYWVAKSVIRNTGTAPLYDLKITYKLGEYTDTSIAEPCNVMPGGAAVDLYHPIFSSQIAQLATATPVQLTVRYTYRDAAGKTYSEEKAQLLTILGVSQFEFSNLSNAESNGGWFDDFNNSNLLPAYVTRLDDVVKQVAGRISRKAGGVAAASTDEDAKIWLKAAYDWEWTNHIVYSTPSAGFLDHVMIQDIKYPRNVLKEHSGTCIDLAITYAALAEAVGLKANLIVKPGHCFCIVRLPQGDILAVENTGIGGTNHLSFEKALEVGRQKVLDCQQSGVYQWIDVDKQLSAGVPNPELPALDADILTKWGYPEEEAEAPTQEEANPGAIGLLFDQTGGATGLSIGAVIPGGPAEEAGIQKGDIITTINGKVASSVAIATQMIHRMRPGQVVKIALIRDGKPFSFDVTVAPLSQIMGFTGLWEGRVGRMNLTLHLEQDGYQAHGSAQATGSLVFNQEIKKATLGKDNSIKFSVRFTSDNGETWTIDFSGFRTGDVLKGTTTCKQRGLFNWVIRTIHGDWTVERKSPQ